MSDFGEDLDTYKPTKRGLDHLAIRLQTWVLLCFITVLKTIMLSFS